jgi:hypothetical protein
VEAISALLDSAHLDTAGACRVKNCAAAPAVQLLRRALQHDDLWLRAASALAAIGHLPCRRCRNCWNASPVTRRRTTCAAWSSGSSPPPSSAGC